MTPNAEPLNRRADADANRDAVVEAAIAVMAARPSASMKEIADASGLGRTTIYRHFPSREDLVRAIVEYVIRDSWTMLGRIAAPERPLADVMRDLGVQAMALGARYRFLDGHRMIHDEVVLELGLEDNDPLVTYVTAARDRAVEDARIGNYLIRQLVQSCSVSVVALRRLTLGTFIHAVTNIVERAVGNRVLRPGRQREEL